MRGYKMDIDWRTVQVFLSGDGVFEVEVDSDNSNKARCSCPSFRAAARCKHVRHVKKQIDLNGGHYSILIPNEVSEDEAALAMKNSEMFREFVIRHAKVEVID